MPSLRTSLGGAAPRNELFPAVSTAAATPDALRNAVRQLHLGPEIFVSIILLIHRPHLPSRGRSVRVLLLEQ